MLILEFEELLAQLTLKEKVSLLSGRDSWYYAYRAFGHSSRADDPWPPWGQVSE